MTNTDTTLERLRFPVGRFAPKDNLGRPERNAAIESIGETPARMRAAVAGLTTVQLATPYRDGGWTVTEVVHHVPDSHMNALCRFKLALTEDTPTIKTYREAEWAKLGDVSGTPIDVSLSLLDSIHARWDVLLRSMSEADFSRRLHHPEFGELDLNFMVQLYEWHGRHHPAHITRLRERKGW